MNIVLIGYRGSGKTTVGRLLAARLHWTFLDLDERIVSRSGMSIKEIFVQQGEDQFRKLESQSLAEAIFCHRCVTSLGGGAVLSEANRRQILQAKQLVIYLRAEAEELHRRITSDPATALNRPHLTGLGGGIAEIRHLLEKREPLYRQVMNAEIDVTQQTAAQVVEAIVPILAKTNPQLIQQN